MTDHEPEVRALLRKWMAEHITQEHEERVKYHSGPAIHAVRAEAHARAALALHRELEGGLRDEGRIAGSSGRTR